MSIRAHPYMPPWLEINQRGDTLFCVVRHDDRTEDYEMSSVHSMQSILVVADVFKQRLIKQAKITEAVLKKLEEGLDDDIPF